MKNPNAVALGKLGGAAKSAAKAAASRENGKLGGRPRTGRKCRRCARNGRKLYCQFCDGTGVIRDEAN